MPTPSVVVFDLGKVLVDFDYAIAARRIAEHATVSADVVRALIDHSPLLVRYETGLLTTEQFFDKVRASTGFHGTLEQFAEFFADIFAPIPQMIDLNVTLRSNGVRTCIFSNTNPLAVTHIRKRFPFFNHFDRYILSYQHGSMKPEAMIYQVVEREMKANGQELVYLDDRAENIEGGARQGWQTVLHENPARSLTILKQLGLPI